MMEFLAMMAAILAISSPLWLIPVVVWIFSNPEEGK